MNHKLILIGIFILFSNIFLGITSAQDEEFDDVYINESQTFEVLLNDSWEIVEDEDDFVTMIHSSDSISIRFFDPSLVGLDTDGAEDVFEATEIIADIFEADAAPKEYPLGERSAARVVLDSEVGELMLVVIEFDSGAYGIMLVNAFDLEDPLIEAISVTYNDVASNAGTAKLNLGQSKKYPNQLEDFDGAWQDAIRELQDAGVIASGGSIVFNEDYAFFSGQGDFFTPLARNSPYTDIIMAGELTFTASGSSDLEQCVLTSRITIRGSSATQYLDVGVTNSGNLVVFDAYGSGNPPNVAFRSLGADLDETIHILYLAIDDTVTVYVNGELFIEDEEVDERSGSYGIALLGQAAGARCEGRNIWVYQAPSFQKGVCEISSSGAVNKRSGPGTNFDRAGQLAGGTVTQAVARGSDGSFTWWKLEDDSWVRDDVVSASGDCLTLPTEDE